MDLEGPRPLAAVLLQGVAVDLNEAAIAEQGLEFIGGVGLGTGGVGGYLGGGAVDDAGLRLVRSIRFMRGPLQVAGEEYCDLVPSPGDHTGIRPAHRA